MSLSDFEQKIQFRFADIVRHLKGDPNSKLSTREEWRYGTNGSLSVMVGGAKAGSWFDHERQIGGGIWDLLYVEKDLQRSEAEEWLARELGIRRGEGNESVITYTYVDERGKTLFWVKRKGRGDGKRIWQEQPGEGKGGVKRKPDGKPDMSGARLVPYHLDELIAAKEKAKGNPWRVYIVEGEKCADRLREQFGAVATTNPMGAGKWRSNFCPFFDGAAVVILPDNDEAGHKHADQVARALVGRAAEVKIVTLPGLAEKGDVWDWLGAGGSQSDLETLIEGTGLFDPHSEDDDDSVEPQGQPAVKSAGNDCGLPPPRPWILGTTFCVGFLSGLLGTGGVGKTAVRLLQLIAVALGRSDLTGEHVFKRVKVLLVCLEDDEDELRRRIRAVCLHHNLDQPDLDGWLFFWTPHDLRLLEIDDRGHVELGALGAALRRIITKLGIGLVCIDPFVKSHGADENNNTMIDRAAGVLLEVAHDCGAAPDYVHHNRKGIALAGDPDNGRGASALAFASRLVKTVTRMTEKEAKQFDIGEQERKLLIRVDDAKQNIAPPAENAVWFRLVGVNIGNATPEYPRGDNVQTVERWHPPAVAEQCRDALSKTNLTAIFDQIRKGHPEEGEFYLSDVRANEDWVGWPICKITDIAKDEAKRLVRDWLKNGVLIEREYYSPKRHRGVPGITVNEVMAAKILG